jgi:alpha-ketoglutarate-dependent taurine dioxygenase
MTTTTEPTAPSATALGRDAAAWRAADLDRDRRWVYALDDADRADLRRGLAAGRVEGKPLLDYRQRDFAFGRSLTTIRRALDEAQHGFGAALIKGLPRKDLSAEEFELLTWAVGLHLGTARPQDKLSRYINEVKDAGTVYRSAGGRGYSSNAELDFHVDSGDVVLLSCYNQAPSGGDSLCSSSVAAYRQLAAERPDLVAALQQPYPFSRQNEQSPGEAPFTQIPIIGFEGGELFCNWNRNRITNGEKIAGAPQISPLQREAMELLDAIVRRPEFMYSMRLEPGDLQILSNHTALHSRTEFHDAPEPEKKRLLYRLWLSTPDGPRLPAGWSGFWESIEPGHVRGGIYGQSFDAQRLRFDEAQAQAMAMHLGPKGRSLVASS